MSTKRLIRISLFTVLTAVGGFIKIPLGYVAFSMQTLFVIMAGLILGRKDGMFAQLVYAILGLVGVPIFTQGGGFQYVFMPSFGYIIGFIAGAFVTGFVMSRFKSVNTWKIWFAGIMGLLPIYIIGMIYQVMILVCVNGITFAAAMASLVSILIFWAIDIAMIFIVALIYPRIMSMIKMRAEQNTENGLM